MPVVLSCPSCSAQQRLTDEQMLVRLQAHGMLRREKNLDFALARELLTTAAEQFCCTKCDCTGLVVGDDWEADVVGARGVGMRGVHIIRGDEDSPGPDAIKDLSGVIDILTNT